MRVERKPNDQLTPGASARLIKNINPQGTFFKPTAPSKTYSTEANPDGVRNLQAIVKDSIRPIF
ncbi:MAG TPA: hypothetical protein PLO43_03990 [Chlamydiales bacterium]|nr:hypothetical protein [Chlamydiales bacterium]HPE85319.1 hypothetical protein [Chlamydiales bacterium]